MIDDIPFYLIGEYRKMMADTTVRPLPTPTRHKLFAAMDRAVHTTPQFAVGLAMSSARIENYETINGENLKGWYIGDGMTYLYDNDLRQYSESFWATVNPYRMAGTTVDTRPRKAETLPLAPGLLYADGYKSPQHWVGGQFDPGPLRQRGHVAQRLRKLARSQKIVVHVRRPDRCTGSRHQQPG